jgi:hypothetical protein
VAYTAQQYETARKKAEEAGDIDAVEFFTNKLNSAYKSAMLKADEAGDKKAVAFFQAKIGGPPKPNISHKGDKKPGDIVPVDLHAPPVQGLTFRYGDEAAAGLAAAQDTIKNRMSGEGPTDFSENYDQNKARLDAQLERTYEEHPIASTVGEVAGAVAAPGLGGAKLIAKVPSLAGKMAAGAGVGVAESALYGSGGGNTVDERLQQAKEFAPYGAAGAAGPVVGAGVAAGARALKKLNKPLEVMGERSAGRVAERIETLKKAGFDPKDVRGSTEKGADVIVKKIQKDLQTEIKTERNALQKYFDPKNYNGKPETLRLATNAIANVLNDQKGTATKAEIAAVRKIVGHTQNGRRLADLIEDKVEAQAIDRRGVKGGISKYTDELNAFAGDNSRLGSVGRAIRALTSLGAWHPIGQATLAAQYGLVGAGRLIDAATGRRAPVELFRKQNLGKAKPADYSYLPTQFEIDSRTRHLARQIKEEIAAEKAASRKSRQDYDQYAGNLKKAGEDYTKQRRAEEVAEAKKRDELKSYRTNATKNAEKEAANLSKAEEVVAAKKQKADREKLKMLRNVALGVEKLKKQLDAEKTSATKPNTKAFADNTPKDAAGRKIKSVKLYNARKGEIIALEQGAKQKAAKAKDPEVKKIIEDAVTLFNTEGRGKQTHKRRIEIFKEAVAKAQSLEQREAVKEALKPLAEVYGKVD